MRADTSLAMRATCRTQEQPHLVVLLSGAAADHGICRLTTPEDMPTAMKPCSDATAVLTPGTCGGDGRCRSQPELEGPTATCTACPGRVEGIAPVSHKCCCSEMHAQRQTAMNRT